MYQKTIQLTIIVLLMSIQLAAADLDLEITSVSPNTATVKKPITIQVNGKSFQVPLNASLTPDIGHRKYITATVKTAGMAHKLLTDSHYLYVLCASRSDEWNGIQVFDIQDTDQPEPVGYLLLDDFGQDIAITNNWLLVTAWTSSEQGKLFVVDKTQPTRPFIRQSIQLNKQPQGLCVKQQQLYIVNTTELIIFDISRIDHIQTLGKYVFDEGYMVDVSVTDSSLACVLDHQYQKLHMIDVSNPASCQKVNEVITAGSYPSNVHLQYNYAYVSDWNGLSIIDLNSMTLQESIETSGYAEGIFVKDTSAYLLDKGGLQVISFADPSNVNIDQTYSLYGWGKDVCATDERAYVCDQTEGVVIIDITQPAQSNLIGEIKKGNTNYSMVPQNNTAFVANAGNGVQCIDISQPDNPKIKATVNSLDYARDVYIQGSYMYVADDTYGLKIYNLTGEITNQVVGELSLFCGPTHVRVLDNTAYLVCTDKVYLIDVSDKQHPTQMDEIQVSAQINDMAIVSNTLFIASNKGVKRYNISSPSSNQLLFPDLLSNTNIDAFYVSDQAVYMANEKTIWKCPIDQPYNVNQLNVITESLISGLYSYNNYLMVASEKGITLYLENNDPLPAEIAFLPTPGKPIDMFVKDMALFCTCEKITLVILPMPVILTPSITSPTQLTLDIPKISRTGHYNLRLFNAQGSLCELLGALTIMEEVPDEKAIIIAGYGPVISNRIWKGTQLCANMAYRVLRNQGYEKEHIRYLSPPDPDYDYGDISIYETPSKSNLQKLLTQWVGQVSRLLIYMIDHGEENHVLLTPGEKLHASILDEYLDHFQQQTNAHVVLVYDACYSGSFIPLMSPPDGHDRLIITSGENEVIKFMNDGGLTFSYPFWTYMLANPNIGQAFSFARQMIKTYQAPQVDADNDGHANNKSDFTKSRIVLKRNYAQTIQKPDIQFISAPQVLMGETSARITADVVPGKYKIKQVLGVITPPDYEESLSIMPVTDFPVIHFKPVKNNTYAATVTQMDIQGVYHICVYAVDEKEFYSLPESIDIIQTRHQIHANFSAQPLIGFAPLDVNFKDLTGDQVLNWTWHFGDGKTSQLRNPVHEYTDSGKYTISLKVDLAGRSDTITRTACIEVKSAPGVAGKISTQILGLETQPVPYVLVSIPELNIVGISDRNGDFALDVPDSINPGNYRLTINTPGISEMEMLVSLRDDVPISIGNVILDDTDERIDLIDIIRRLKVLSGM
jgi:hypothetical protein